MPELDTIAARGTAPGRSWRAMIRISGPATRSLLHDLTGDAPNDRLPNAARLILNRATLPVLRCFFASPRSYTGEDLAEIQLPGNPSLVDRVLASIVSRPGVRSARPGEFTARAFLNGKMPLEEAEGIAATISAETDDQLAAAGSLLSGETGRRYRAWSDEAISLLALVEAGIDFTDQEDVVAISPAALAARLAALIDALSSFTGGARAAEATTALPTVALVGAPNAGKSTLFNALLGKRRSVASPIAGSTRDIIAETLDLSPDLPGGGPVVLMDLAGLDDPRSMAGPAEALGQQAARRAAAGADAIVWCDPTGRFDGASLGPHVAGGANLIRVQTFGDRPGEKHGLCVCALDGWNLASLRRAIADAAFGGDSATLASLLPRHRAALHAAAGSLRAALDATGNDPRLARPEEVAESLRAALVPMGELVGRIDPDDVLGRVFATFCVGK